VTATVATVYRQHREIGYLKGRGIAPASPEVRNQTPLAHGPDIPETY
jgi:lipopolysaccharide assembly protein A